VHEVLTVPIMYCIGTLRGRCAEGFEGIRALSVRECPAARVALVRWRLPLGRVVIPRKSEAADPLP